MQLLPVGRSGPRRRGKPACSLPLTTPVEGCPHMRVSQAPGELSWYGRLILSLSPRNFRRCVVVETATRHDRLSRRTPGTACYERKVVTSLHE